jgi:hypothetical protein
LAEDRRDVQARTALLFGGEPNPVSPPTPECANMIRSLAFASVAVLLSVATAQAQTSTTTPAAPMKMSCTEADMAKMQTQANAMTDSSKKAMVTKEMDMAKDKMAEKKMDDCMMHMKNAEQAMMK